MIRSLICLVFGHKPGRAFYQYWSHTEYQEWNEPMCLRCYKTNLPMP